ncbi:MAG: hypothetical protein ACK6BG_14860 [Cyanobacteriota bacterium]
MGANLLDGLEGDPPLYALHPLVRQFFSLQCRGWEPEPMRRKELSAAAQGLAKGCEGEDLPRSVEYWRQATHADPADIWAAFGLGYGLLPLGDTEGARQAFEHCRRNAEAANDPRGVSCAWNGIGDVLVSKGDGAGALAAFQASLAIAEGLAKRDPANTQWQVDLAISCSKLGTVERLLDVSTRRAHLQRGLDILLTLKQSGRLHANQDFTPWFEAKIQKLNGVP